jgi:TetR/AcrR family transcriptional regulator, transcriptional repressor for nem operon
MFQKESFMARLTAAKTRNSAKTRAHILGVAFEEIYRHGFRGASVNSIIDKTELTKGAFFHHFPTKEVLGYAIADEILVSLVLDRWVRPLDNYENPLEGISHNFKKIIETTPEEHLSFGCPLNNLVQEMAPEDPVFSEKLNSVLEKWIEGIELNLKRAQKRGFLRSGVNLRRLAEFIVMGHEGAFGMVKMIRDRKVFFGLQVSLRDYLKTLQV